MDSIFNWVMNCPNDTMVSKIITCDYGSDVNNESVSGNLVSGTFLLIGYKRGEYANVTAYSYWNNRSISVATIENGTWAKRFDRVITNSDLGGAVFQPASGNIKYGINGIYIGRFSNGPIESDGAPFASCIYLIGTGTNQTSIYAFTITQYSQGHLFFNRMNTASVMEFETWKKLL